MVKIISLKNRKNIIKFAGIFKDDNEWKKIMADIEKDRVTFKLRKVKF